MSVSLQKANFWKRFSAYLFDTVCVICVAMALVLLFSVVFQTDKYTNEYNAYRAEYAEKYEINLKLTKEEYDAFTEEEKKAYDDTYAAFSEALLGDKRVQEVNAKILTLTVSSVSLSLFIATLGVHFIIPLVFKNGQTLGKKIFSLAVVRTSTVKVSSPVLFVRSMLGLYAIETMFPLLLVYMIFIGILGSVGWITIGLFFILQIFVMIRTQGSSIHDLLSDTAVVDMVSQRIFSSEEELLEFQKEEAAQKANATEK